MGRAGHDRSRVRGGGAIDPARFSRTQRHALRRSPGGNRRRPAVDLSRSSTTGSTGTPGSSAPSGSKPATGWRCWLSTTACCSSPTTAFPWPEPCWWPSTPGSRSRSSSTSWLTARPKCCSSTTPMLTWPGELQVPVMVVGAEYEAGLAAASPYGRAARRRVVTDRGGLHERHHRAAEGRHVPPPGRLPAEPGHGVSRRPGPGQRVSVDAADVSLQRLVLHLGGHRRRAVPTCACPGSCRRRCGT